MATDQFSIIRPFGALLAAIVLALPLMLGLASVTQAQERVLVSTVGQESAQSASKGSPVAGVLFGAGILLDHGQSFTTGSNSEGYKLTSVEIQFGQIATGLTYTASIQSVTSGKPGSVVDSLTTPSFSTSSTDQILKFSAPAGGITLAASTEYFLVLEVSGTRTTQLTSWRNTQSDDEDNSSLTDWAVDNDHIYRNRFHTDQGWRDNIQSSSLKFRINGEVIITPPGVTISEPTKTEVTEGNTSDMSNFTVVLDSAPTNTVSVVVTAPTGLELDGPDSSATFSDSETLMFTTVNWETAQTVRVRAINNSVDNPGVRQLSVSYSTTSKDSNYNNLSGTAVTLSVTDNDPTSVTLSGSSSNIGKGETKSLTLTLNRGLVSGETLPIQLIFGGSATRNTDYTIACPTSLPTRVTCNNLNTDNSPTVTFTGPAGTGTTANSVTLTLTVASDIADGEDKKVEIGLGELDSSSGTGLGGGARGIDNLMDFSIDTSAPELSISGVPKKINSTAELTANFTFTEDVMDFIASDVTISGGTAGTFSESGKTYSLAITPSGNENIVVRVAANAVTDGVNMGPASAVTATAIWDATPPSLREIVGIPEKINSTTPFMATFNFSEPVTEFVIDDVSVSGGNKGTFSGSGASYTLAITPSGNANVVVTVAANAATDGVNMGPASAVTATAIW
ncbi:MAG: Ig-like domain-containing protein, partial [Gammaproteobacteria bacterium]|nr:Ig-like domain-containing protein [Gammaproteobacteria bacterium]